MPPWSWREPAAARRVNFAVVQILRGSDGGQLDLRPSDRDLLRDRIRHVFIITSQRVDVQRRTAIMDVWALYKRRECHSNSGLPNAAGR